MFAGWYADKTCTQPFTFDRAPKDSLTVYAKRRKVQYRVFLHPNVEEGEELDLGSENQQMSFRVDN